MATKAEQIWDEINRRVEAGTDKADAFRELAESYGQPVTSIRGAYYGHKRKIEGGGSRPRKRETSPADAVEAAKVALRRGIEAIDRELVAAEERAREAALEAKSLKGSAADRKAEIEAKIAALES